MASRRILAFREDSSGFTSAEKALVICFALATVGVVGYALTGGGQRAGGDARTTLMTGSGALTGGGSLGQVVGSVTLARPAHAGTAAVRVAALTPLSASSSAAPLGAQTRLERLEGWVKSVWGGGSSGGGGGGFGGLTDKDKEAAMQAIAMASDSRDARYVADWLRAHPDPAQRAAFMALLAQYGPVMANVLDATGQLSGADQQMIAAALAAAYRDGQISQAQLHGAIAPAGSGAAPGAGHRDLANLIAMTGNSALITAYAKAELRLVAASDSYDQQRAAAAAVALSKLSPAELQSFLANNKDLAAAMMTYINVDGNRNSGSDALGLLLDAARGVQPPTREVLALFQQAIPRIGDNPASQAAASRFFSQNFEVILGNYRTANGELSTKGQSDLSLFFAYTLFGDKYEGQAELQKDLMRRLGAMTGALNQYGDTPSGQLPNDVKRDAREMGSLVGAIEGGFQVSVDLLNKRNAARDGMVDLFFSAKGLLPGLPMGGNILKDMTIGQIQSWVKEGMHEHARDPNDAIPFHSTFSALIRNPDLATDYEATRATAFVNRQQQLAR